MRRGGPKHPKIADLAADLGIPKAYAVGLLECLWHWVDYYAPRGDVGRYGDAAIADAAGWDGEPAAFVAALVRWHWLDADPTHRLLVHDWHHHADQYTRRRLATLGTWFINVRKPVGKTAIHDGRRRRASRVMKLSGSESVAEHCVKPEEEDSDPTTLRQAANTNSKGWAEEFPVFWKLYPRKEKKPRALRAWLKIDPRPPVAIIGEAVERQKQSEQWQKDGGQFIPHPASWLNDRQWEDRGVEDVAKGEAAARVARIQAMKDQWDREHPEARLRRVP